MAAPKGNQFWKLADPECLGRPPMFETQSELWEKAKLYFQECDENPMQKDEVTTTEKGSYYKTINYKIPYTWEGLYVFLGVSNLDRYKKLEEFIGVTTHIDNVIRNQKYSGAAAGLFNANIIARDLGLVDKTENKNKNTTTTKTQITFGGGRK